MTTRGVLYAMSAGAWNKGVPYLEHGSALAFVEVAPGRYLCRPRFNNAWSETAWKVLTGAVEVTEADFDDEILQRVASNQLM